MGQRQLRGQTKQITESGPTASCTRIGISSYVSKWMMGALSTSREF